MSQLDSTTINTIRLMTEGGTYHVPADSGGGSVYRPQAKGDRGGRISTLETLYDYFIDNVPLPSQALQKNPNFLEQLHTHPYVTGAMLKRCITVAAFPWRIEANPAGPDKEFAKTVAEYATAVWGQIPHIEQLYYQCDDEGVLKGGVGFEFNWHREASGVERPAAFNMVAMDRFVFDRQGNMALKTRDYPVWGAYVSANQSQNYIKQYPRGKFMYHVHQQRAGTWDNPGLEGYMYYGLGLDVALYIPITFDSFVLRFRMKWLEKYGLPPTILYHPINEPLQGEVVRIADSLRGESIITIPTMGFNPDGSPIALYSIEQMEVPSMTNDAFNTFSKEWTKPNVNQIILGDAEENGGGGESGGYSERVTRRDSGLLAWARWDAINISGTINRDIMPPLARGRWANLPPEYVPIHKLEPKEEKDRMQEAQILETASQILPIAEDEAYERIGYRKPKGGEKTIGGQQQSPDDPFEKMPGTPGTPKHLLPLNAGGSPMPNVGIGQRNGGGSVANKQRTMPRVGA